MISSLSSRLRSFWRGLRLRSKVEDEMREEMEHHLAMRAEDLERSGMPRREARRRARLEFGPIELTKESARAARGLHRIDGIRFSLLDVKLGLRMLARHPGMTMVAVFALSIGIPVGLAPMHLAAAIEAPLPVPDGERIRTIRFWDVGLRRPQSGHYYDLALMESEIHSFDALAATRSQLHNVSADGGTPSPILSAEVTVSTFEMIDATPLLGRLLTLADMAPAAPKTALIGYDLWQSRFGGDAGVLGKTLRVGAVSHEVVGVMPEGFVFPIDQQLWLPLVDEVAALPGEGTGLRIFGRLSPGVSDEEAQAELELLGERLIEESPVVYERLRPEVVPYGFNFIGLERGGLWTMAEFYAIQVLAFLLLFVACSNVSMLMLARTVTRSREIAVRTALGAGRGRILSQMFVESSVLSLVAAGAGLALVEVLLGRLRAWMAASDALVPYWLDLGVNREAALWALTLALLSGAVAGVPPAVKVTGKKVQRTLQSTQAGRSGIRFGGVTSALVVADVAIAIAVLGFAFGMADRMKDAFEAEEVVGIPAEEYLSVQVRLPSTPAGPDGASSRERFVKRLATIQRSLVETLEGEPGVRSVGVADALPRMDHRSRRVELEGVESEVGRRGRYVRVVKADPGYLESLDQSILSGRHFSPLDVDQDSGVVIVNSVFVERLLEGRNPIGRRLRFLGDDDSESPWVEIVGVVGPLGTNLVSPEAASGLYLPARAGTIHPLRLGLHLGSDPEGFVPRLRGILAEIDPNAVMEPPVVLSKVFQGDWYIGLATTAGLGLLVVILVALAASALFAMISFSVTERTREIGIRSALGAQRRSLVFSILRRAMTQIGVGAILGMPLSVWFFVAFENGTGLSLRVFSTTLALGLTIMVVIGLLSCVEPTRRVLRIEPSEALRVE